MEVVPNDLGPIALPQIGKKEGFYYCELFPDCGCHPTKDLWSLSFSPTTDSDLAFGADPFGDRAASEDLPQWESQPDSEGEPFFLLRTVPPLRMYPHIGSVESFVFDYYRLGLGLRRRSLRRQGGLRRCASAGVASLSLIHI